MRFKIVLVISVVIFEISCEKFMPEYTRIKRAKYYSSPPQRYYRRPSYSGNGPISYTPPPGYNTDDEEPHPVNSPSRPFKVSKRPTNEGLSDEDIINMMKYLSKQDLDKIVEFAAEKDRRSPPKYRDVDNIKTYKDTSEIYDSQNSQDQEDFNERLVKKREDTSVYKENNNYKFPSNAAVNQDQKVDKQYIFEYANKAKYMQMTTPRNIIYATPPNNQISDIPLEAAESSNPFNFVNQYISNELSSSNSIQNANIAPPLNPKMVESENNLPRPINLREEPEYEISSSNNIPAVLQADSSYKVESFGELPLMNYDSKLHSVSSYHVPRYTVTSPRPEPQQYGPPQKSPQIEAAPPPSAAHAQSDAHLKAIRIWTHKSRGTAYTLNNDGTLSLERPLRPKPKYGYP